MVNEMLPQKWDEEADITSAGSGILDALLNFSFDFLHCPVVKLGVKSTFDF